jgi:hypothetical protein
MLYSIMPMVGMLLQGASWCPVDDKFQIKAGDETTDGFSCQADNRVNPS